jgi:hypothetical protein
MAKGSDGKTSGPGGQPANVPGQGDQGGLGTTAGRQKSQDLARSSQPTSESGRTSNGVGVATDSPAEAPANGAGQPSRKPKETTARLFQPGPTPPSTPKNKPVAGAASGDQDGPLGGSATRLGKTGKVPDVDDIDAIADPKEREAALKLRQAVQRIKANRERRGNPTRGGSGSSQSPTRRDW